MNTLYINITRPVRRLAAITIVAVLAVSFAVIVFAWLGDYATAVGEALGNL